MTRNAPAGPGLTAPGNWNLPNVITVVRILLAPLFVWLLLADAGQDGALRWWAALLFVVAIATDGVDGAIARRQGLVTELGKLLDPIADKVLTGGALVALSLLGELWWWVTGLILLREVGITVFRFAMLRDHVIPASRGGKLKTILQSVAIALFLFPLWLLVGDGVHVFNAVVMGAALVLTVVTGVDYLVKAARERKRTDA